MNKIEKKYFKEFPDTRITLIDKINNKNWPEWKKFSECSDLEIKQANLRELFPNELVIDIENKDTKNLKELLNKYNYRYLLFDSGSRGTHTHIFFINLKNYSKEIRKDIRKEIIKEFNADESKASESTLIAMFDRPHFKTLQNKILLEDNTNGDLEQMLPKEPILRLRAEKFKSPEKAVSSNGEDFKDYHIKDTFFNFIKTNIIPDNTNRDNIVFPNLAIALVKEGLNEIEIREIMTPIINNNFPGKTYSEFYGWVKKAMTKQIDTYNIVQLNSWAQLHFGIQNLYDITPIDANQWVPKEKKLNIYSFKEFNNLQIPETQWLVEEWLPIGDICFVVGRTSSYKSSVCAHIGMAMTTNKLVFNKYKVVPGNVLYVDEENNRKGLRMILQRIQKGLDANQNIENFFISNGEGISFDNQAIVELLIKELQEHNIKLLILDSFRRYFVGRENDATEMAKVFNVLKYIRRSCEDLTILIIHHMKKESTTGKLDPREMLRGSSDIANFADSIISVDRRHQKNIFAIEQIKSRARLEKEKVGIVVESGEGNDMFYFREVATLDEYEDKKSLTESCEDVLINALDKRNISIFKKSDILSFEELMNFKERTIRVALDSLVSDGTLSKLGDSKQHTQYQYNKYSQTEL